VLLSLSLLLLLSCSFIRLVLLSLSLLLLLSLSFIHVLLLVVVGIVVEEVVFSLV